MTIWRYPVDLKDALRRRLSAEAMIDVRSYSGRTVRSIRAGSVDWSDLWQWRLSNIITPEASTPKKSYVWQPFDLDEIYRNRAKRKTSIGE